jgi:hypothetical protein
MEALMVKKTKPPLYHKVIMKVDPTQGVARLAASLSVPGYTFFKLVRKKEHAVITFRRAEY